MQYPGTVAEILRFICPRIRHFLNIFAAKSREIFENCIFAFLEDLRYNM